MNTQKCPGLTTKQVNACDRFERNFITKAYQTVSYRLVTCQFGKFSIFAHQPQKYAWSI